MGRVIAAGSRKGGVGKTTTAVDLVALRDPRPGILDLQGNATTSVALRPAGDDDET